MSGRLESLDPATGDVVGTHPIADAPAVDKAVARARDAAGWWSALMFAERRGHLDRWKGVLARRLAELAEVVHAETGKPRGDAQLEIGLAIEHLAWAAAHAGSALGRRRVRPGLLTANIAGHLEYLPLGVVGVIGPWNYPVFTPMGSIAYALAAGNAVVFKPSELTPGVGVWLAEAWAEAVPGPPVLQVVTGYGETGSALCRAGVDKVSFTGSTATGKLVMAACAQTLTPVLIEAGGKDALLVDADADVAAAADAAVWGAMANSGQTCTGVERVYVHHAVYAQFLTEVTRLARDVRAGADPDAQYGPMTLPAQVEVVRRHIDDALARGGTAVVGGADTVGDRFIGPTVLTGVSEDSVAVTEETFGPTMTIRSVASMDEAVELANASRYGLGSTVYSRTRGPELARRLRSGMTSVNAVIAFAGIPALPFGGVGDSGFGRVHGVDGLREFTYAKAVATQLVKPLLALTTFGRTPTSDRRLARILTVRHGGGTRLPSGLPQLLSRRRGDPGA